MAVVRTVSASNPDRTATGRAPRGWWMVAIVAGALLGPIDLGGQVVAPYPWAHLFNSPAVWAAAAFGYGRWARHRLAAPVGAVIVLVVGVEAYYLADVLVRGADSGNLTSPTAAVWVVAGILAGVVFGMAGSWAPARAGWRAVLGRAAVPAVLGAEAVRDAMRVLTEDPDGRPDDLGQLAALLALLAVVALVALVRGLDRRTTVPVVAVALGAAASVGLVATAVLAA